MGPTPDLDEIRVQRAAIVPENLQAEFDAALRAVAIHSKHLNPARRRQLFYHLHRALNIASRTEYPNADLITNAPHVMNAKPRAKKTRG